MANIRSFSGRPYAAGLHFIDLAWPRPSQLRLEHGVPLFVGFGTVPSSSQPVVEIDRWEYFESLISTPPNGFLGEAVRGFFANGGKRCVVWPQCWSEAESDLASLFDPKGPAEDISDINLVCVPDAVSDLCKVPVQEVQSAIIRHCMAMGDRFAILDTPLPGSRAADSLAKNTDVGALLNIRSLLPKSHFAALYFPALHIELPLVHQKSYSQGIDLVVPPCGHIAGIYARSDVHTGVHKAPANEIVEGALAVECNLSEAEYAQLNEAGINCIRSMSGRGIRVMGARTLSNRPGWLYVPVARMLIELKRWLNKEMFDIAFDSHTPELWEHVRRRIEAYCFDLIRAGALAGTVAADAFFVKCDAETNPPDSQDAGLLVVEVGLAPSVPAEFVLVCITYDGSGIAVAEI